MIFPESNIGTEAVLRTNIVITTMRSLVRASNSERLVKLRFILPIFGFLPVIFSLLIILYIHLLKVCCTVDTIHLFMFLLYLS